MSIASWFERTAVVVIAPVTVAMSHLPFLCRVDVKVRRLEREHGPAGSVSVQDPLHQLLLLIGCARGTRPASALKRCCCRLLLALRVGGVSGPSCHVCHPPECRVIAQLWL